MVRYLPHAVVLWTTAVCFSQPSADPAPPSGGSPGFTTRSANLHRVKDIFTGDVRVIWLGDSWSMMHHSWRLPYGSLMVWPIERLTAVTSGHTVSGPTKGEDFTFGPGQLELVDSAGGWIAETNDGEPARIALPINSMSRVIGDPNLLLNAGWSGPPRIQSLGVQNGSISLGDLPVFSTEGDSVRVRPLYYCPRDIPDLAEGVVFCDQDGTVLDVASPRVDARAMWYLGGNPDSGVPTAPVTSQINALAYDLPLASGLGQGVRLVTCEDPDRPFVGSNAYWFSAGASFYLTDGSGRRIPGYHHSGLSTGSWQYQDFATDHVSNGNKRFSNEQLINWLDVTTLDRSQRPIIILHIASEQLTLEAVRERLIAIINRFRTVYAEIGAARPRFLFTGAYMHRITTVPHPSDRLYVETANQAMLDVARSDADCAFVSLYALTDGQYFTTDNYGGAGTQQAARDWLDSHGWSTITYGGTTYNLSSADDEGLDGVLVSDGLHMGSTPAAAFFAELIAEEILAAPCPGDFDGDGAVNTRDVLAFLNAWATGDASADFDGNGTIDTRDVLAFLNAWAEAC